MYYDVTMRRFHETIVTLEQQNVLHISVCMWLGVGARTDERTGGGLCACARVALVIQHSMRRRNIFCGMSGSTIFFRHYLINDTIFGKKSYLI